MAQVVAIEARALGKEAVEAEEAVQRRGGGGERATGSQIWPPIGTLEGRPDRAGGRIVGQKLGQDADAILAHQDIGIEQKNEFACARGEARVVGASKAKVLLEANHGGLGLLRLD